MMVCLYILLIPQRGLREATGEVGRIGDPAEPGLKLSKADRIILMLDGSLILISQNIEKVRSEFLSKFPNNMPPVTIVRQ